MPTHHLSRSAGSGAAEPGPQPALRERLFAAAVVAAGVVLLLVVAELDPELLGRRLWAFEHLRDLPRWARWAACLLLVAAATAGGQRAVWGALGRAAAAAARAPRAAALGAGSAVFSLFWLLRQRNLELGDSALLIQLLTRYVHLRGFHVTYDEPGELYLHSVVYRLLHATLDWPVEDAYALLSALAGVVFVLVAARLWRDAAATPGRRAVGLGLMMSTAALQLFFGYVENYTLVTLGMVVYAALAQSCLAGRCRIVWPALALGCSICLHVLAGWLLPSLVYLALVVREPGGGRPRAVAGQLAVGLLAPAAGTVGGLTALGVPAEMLGKTHLAHLKFVFLTEPGSPQFVFAPFSAAHLAAQANQLLLVGLPALLIGAWILLFARHELDTADRFWRLLVLASLSLQAFASTWNPELGAYHDWDLFAVAGVFFALTAAYSLARLPIAEWRLRNAALPVLALSLVLVGSWVTSNARRTHAVDALHDDAHLRAAARHERAGRHEAAARDLQEALRLNPRNGAAALALAELLAARGETARAAATLEAYLAHEDRGARAEQARRMLRELDGAR